MKKIKLKYCYCSDVLLMFRSIGLTQPQTKCKRVFQALVNVSIEELCETADALIAPVRMGIARPTAPFSLVSSTVDAIQVSSTRKLLTILSQIQKRN